MHTRRPVLLFALPVLAALAACEDGGPPNPLHRPSMQDAPTLAADSGTTTPDLDAEDAGPGPGPGPERDDASLTDES